MSLKIGWKYYGKVDGYIDRKPICKVLDRIERHVTSFKNFKIYIVSNINLDQRVYNIPTADQVAAIWIEGNHGNIPFERDIIVHAHSGNRHRVKHYFSCYDPLQYPLLFPMGESGWHQDIKKKDIEMILDSQPLALRIQWKMHTYIDSMEELLQTEHQGNFSTYCLIVLPNISSFQQKDYLTLKYFQL